VAEVTRFSSKGPGSLKLMKTDRREKEATGGHGEFGVRDVTEGGEDGRSDQARRRRKKGWRNTSVDCFNKSWG